MNGTICPVIPYLCLCETLIPFGEPIDYSTDKSMGQVPNCDATKDYPNINADASVKDFECLCVTWPTALVHLPITRYRIAGNTTPAPRRLLLIRIKVYPNT